MNNRAIDLQLIKPVKPGSSGSKGKIFLKQLLKEELKELNVPTYDSCCGEVPPETEPFNLVTTDSDSINFSGSGTIEDPLTAEVVSINGLANVRLYGAVGDGVTDDSQAFADAIATQLTVEVPPGDYLISQELILNDGQRIFGYGRESNIVTATNGTTVDLTSAYNILQIFNNCTVDNLRFTGNGKLASYVFPWTTQNAIWVQGNNNNINNCWFLNLRGSGVLSVKTDLSNHSNSRIQGCYFEGNTVGMFTYVGGEYWTISNNSFFTNTVNINEMGANNVYSGCSITYATQYGVRAFGNGGNSDHTMFSGCTINHNTGTMQIANLVNGMQFVACHFYGGPITISESVKVIFLGCGFGSATTMTVTATTAKETLISSCYYQSPFAPTNSATSAVITEVNNI